jgi:ribosomal protein S3
MISNQIEKRMPYKRAIKQAIKQAMEKGAKGIKVKV